MNKNVFIFWSGGLDSTSLIHKNLEAGNKVTTAYINITSNDNQSLSELHSIKSISSYFQKYEKFTYNGILSDIHYYKYKNCSNFPLGYIPILIMNIASFIMGANFDEIQIGYVLGDDAVAHLSELENLYRGYQEFFIDSWSKYKNAGLNKKYGFPELKFPFYQVSKIRLIKKFDRFYVKRFIIKFCRKSIFYHGVSFLFIFVF